MTSFARHRRTRIAHRFTPFAFGWVAMLLVWLGVFALEGRLAPSCLVAAAVSVGALAVAARITAAAPGARRVLPVVVATCIVLGLGAAVVVDGAGVYGEILAFILLTLYLGAALVFGWGWRAELALLASTLVPCALVLDRFPAFVSRLELAAAVAIGSAVALAIAEGTARDMRQVARRRRAQEAAVADLQASEERFRSSFDYASIGMAVVGTDGKAIEVNQAFATMLGYDRDALVGRRMDTLAHPDDVATVLVEAWRLLTGEIRAFEMEKRYLHSDGHVVWGLLNCSLTRDETGGPRHVIAHVQDISERKSAELALRESEARYRSLVQSQREWVVRMDLDGRVTFVNDVYVQIFGEGREAILGRTVLHRVHPDDRAMVERGLAALREPPHRVKVECRNVTPEGVRWVQWEGGAIFDADGRPVEVQSVGRDVTERREAEELLRESEERFRRAFDDAAIGMALTTIDGRTLRVNAALCAMLGYSEAEMLTLAPQDVVHPDDVTPAEGDRARLAAGQDASYRADRRYRHRDGRILWVHVTASLIRDASGAPQYFLAQIQDVTERHTAEEALRASVVELRRSEERLRLLARRQATIREEERKRVGFDLHDDVCQELTGIGILVESLRRKVGPVPVEVAAEFDRVVRYLGEVVEHLRLLARELRPFLLREIGLVGSLRSLVEGSATSALAVTADFATPIPRLDEETEVTVYRIAQEALTNAVRHAGARAIVVALAAADGTLTVSVRDDGRGFDPAARPAAALGLASMEERALALGGRLDVRSAPGAGTTITLRCPLDGRRAVRVRELADSSPTRSSSRLSAATTPRAAARD